jgi:hypothetical protein|tara:strand:- start:219 stop:668 length:450 start_codon:yes stop_codon:yes gene_type:complete
MFEYYKLIRLKTNLIFLLSAYPPLKMKNLFLLFLFTGFISCSIFKSQDFNPFVGVFQVKVLDVDGAGDVPAILSIFKNNDNYISTIIYEIEGVENDMEILSSYEIDHTTFIIEAFLDGNQIDFELNFEDNKVTGIAAGTFEVEGYRITK